MRLTLIILSLMAVLATACGSETDSADTTDESAIASVEVDGDTQADVEADAPDVSTDVAGLGDRCTEIAEAFTSVPAALGSAATGTVDAAAVQAQADAFAEVSADVPAEYADDFQLYADYFQEIAIAIESGDPASLGTLATTASSADFTAASTSLANFFAAGCQ